MSMTEVTMTKEELLLLIEEQYGVQQSGRKVRSDKGKSHVMTTNSRQQRSDKGQQHNYTVTAASLKQKFDLALQATALRNELGEVVGEGATRDANGIFDVRVTKKWRKVTTKDRGSYMTKASMSKPLELFRWNWLRQEAIESGSKARFCKFYHIDPNEFDMWTFTEWAIAYMDTCGGHVMSPHTVIRYLDDNNEVINYKNTYKLFEKGE